MVAELIKYGYLHNHARMWFKVYGSSPKSSWEPGADFFYKNLLDGDLLLIRYHGDGLQVFISWVKYI